MSRVASALPLDGRERGRLAWRALREQQLGAGLGGPEHHGRADVDLARTVVRGSGGAALRQERVSVGVTSGGPVRG